jgi:hypothetical protein
MALTADLTVKLKATQTGANDFGGPRFTPTVEKIIALTDGTTVNKADILWVDERTVASAAADAIDLAGVLTDAFGTTVTAAEIVAVLIVNEAEDGTANTTALTVGGGSNPWIGVLGGTAPTIGPLQPGGVLFIASGHASGIGAVVAGTGDTLTITNAAGAAATYQIAVVARSA